MSSSVGRSCRSPLIAQLEKRDRHACIAASLAAGLAVRVTQSSMSSMSSLACFRSDAMRASAARTVSADRDMDDMSTWARITIPKFRDFV